jgi:Tfp pilus assembly protein PilO
MNIEHVSFLFKRIHLIRWMLGAILINVLIFTFYVIPNRSKVANLQAQYAGIRQDALEEQRHLKDLQTRLVRLQQAEKDLNYLYTTVLLPKKSGVMDIRLELEGLAQELQVKRSDFSYVYDSIPGLHLQEFKVSVPIEGSYGDIRRFINSIERSQHFLILDRVDLTSVRADVLNLSFSVSTYLVENEI